MRITQHPDGTITIDTGGHATKEIARGGDTVAGRIFKADAAQRKTWHVFYPADKADVAVAMDGHRDFAGKVAVEKAAHDYLLKHRKVGLMHADGTDGTGDLVESGIHHGPDWVMKAADGSEQRVLDGDWTGTIQWDVPTWERWEKGELRGVSPQGGAVRGTPTDDALAGLRKGAGTAEKGDVGITELVEFEVTRVDGVISPANGFPVLMMKGLGDPDGVAKGQRDCPKCEKKYDADHQGSKCENCGADLPDAPASKAADEQVKCPTCKGDGKIMGGKRDCPDCDASGKVTPDKAKTLASKSAGPPAWLAVTKQAITTLGRPVGTGAYVFWNFLKAMDQAGNVDEQPDIDGGKQAIALIGKLIGYEAEELAAGNAGEADDIQVLCSAVDALRYWVSGEQVVAAGNIQPATALMQSAAEWEAALEKSLQGSGYELVKCDAEREGVPYKLAKAKYSAAGRRKMAEQGNALSDGSYPVGDEEDLKSAAILAQSGHGDVDGAKRLIGRRAKELGVKNPLESDTDDASKSRIAKEDATVDNGTQETGGLAKAVEDAVAKATEPLKKLREELEATLAKVKATPVPGGPVLSRNVQVKQPGGVVREDMAAKAAYYREMADTVTDRETADGYRKLAREADAKAVTPTS